MANPKKIKFRVTVPAYLTSEQREQIGNKIIDRITERTRQEYRDKDNVKFPAYSKGYIESLDFRIAGKSKSRVDLTLSGDMLDSLEILQHGQSYIEIGYRPDSPEAGKVEGNVTGSYGQPSGNPGKIRNFLGIKENELNNIIEEVEKQSPTERLINEVVREQATNQTILNRILFRGLSGT